MLLLKKMINYAIVVFSIIILLLDLSNLLAYPINIYRSLMYLALIIPILIIILDLGSNEALSKRIDIALSRRKSLVVQAIIISVVVSIGVVFSICYATSLINSGTSLGMMYSVDEVSINVSALPIAAYIIYYFLQQLYQYIVPKICKG